jgi:lipoprotein-anchoring transpeptidase ErfK/SrfK
MKSIIGYLGSVLLALIVSVAPGFANANETSSSVSTSNDNKPIVLAYNSSHKGGYSGGYPQYRPAAGVPVFIFNPKTRMWAVYSSGGKLLKVGKGSGGKGYCADIRRSCRTPSGVYHIIAKKGASCKSSKYPVGKGGAPMPYCTFFTKNHGIHGSYDIPNYNASHGCIRVRPADAKWIQSVMPIGSIVIVKSY